LGRQPLPQSINPWAWQDEQSIPSSHAQTDWLSDPTEHVSIVSRQPMRPSAQQEQPATSEPSPHGVRPLMSVGTIGRTAHENVSRRARKGRVRFDAETRPWPIKTKSRRSIVKIHAQYCGIAEIMGSEDGCE
jgi:hypothetical protein